MSREQYLEALYPFLHAPFLHADERGSVVVAGAAS
jgi:hypothetical protein